MDTTNIPIAMQELNQWVCSDDDKIPKIPMKPNQYSSCIDKRTWRTFKEAVHSVSSGRNKYIGFVFTKEDPFCFIDLDNCIDDKTGEFDTSKKEIIDNLNSYTELSKSELGIHIIVRATLNGKDRNRKGGIEIYDSGRYAIITSNRLENYPLSVVQRQKELDKLYNDTFSPSVHEENHSNNISLLTDEQIIEKASHAKNGQKFTMLFSGDIGEYGSHSEADQALCNILSFWCCGNHEQIERILRLSGLIRDKWERKDYMNKTISNAINGTRKFYTGRMY